MLTPLPPGTASSGYYISDEDRFTGNAAQFAGALFDVDVPDPSAAEGFVSRAVESSHLANLLGVNLGPNLRPDGFKSVRHLTRANNPLFDPTSDHALDELDTLLACLGTTCPVNFEPVRYVLVFDAEPRPGGPASGKQCWRDGHMAFPTPLVPCKWEPEDSPAAATKAYDEYPANFVFTTGTFVRAYVSGQTTEQFFEAIGPDGPRPAPTGQPNDPFWKLVSGTDVPVTRAFVPLLALTVAEAQAFDQDAVRPIDYSILRPGGNVTVRGIVPDGGNGLPGGFAPVGIWQKPDGTRVWVDYDLDTDTTVDRLGNVEADIVTVENDVAALETTQQQHTTWIGTLGNLLTNAKGNLVAAINELFAALGNKANLVNGKVPAAELPFATATARGIMQLGKGLRGAGETTAVDFVTEIVTTYDGVQDLSCGVGLAYAASGYAFANLSSSGSASNFGRPISLRNTGTAPLSVRAAGVEIAVLLPGEIGWWKALLVVDGFEQVLHAKTAGPLTSGGGSGGSVPAATPTVAGIIKYDPNTLGVNASGQLYVLTSGGNVGVSAVPTNVVAVRTPNVRTRIDWDAMPGANFYLVSRSENGGPWNLIFGVPFNFFEDDTNIGGGAGYTRYRVTSANSAGQSAASNFAAVG